MINLSKLDKLNLTIEKAKLELIINKGFTDKLEALDKELKNILDGFYGDVGDLTGDAEQRANEIINEKDDLLNALDEEMESLKTIHLRKHY
jgi:hypothetical protein